ncbi:hypothetical protein BDY21DRAFT_359188 [Lineolata rhizophorae]|uniref:Uncharacterized protein n=1 Tax=Lineolata rhizophorae TaxID=578093 RepID=A0A6A6NLA3_9PEZI|nr:hypothetical protein BDY21DRAFT_359188 [Lineolata rhizophorae]
MFVITNFVFGGGAYSAVVDTAGHMAYLVTNITFLNIIKRLKNLPRSGWVKWAVLSPETVSGYI